MERKERKAHREQLGLRVRKEQLEFRGWQEQTAPMDKIRWLKQRQKLLELTVPQEV
jgi:hypothetical protein